MHAPKRVPVCVALVFLYASQAFAQSSRSTTLAVSVQPQCGLSVSSTAIDSAADTVTVFFNYKLRTGAIAGGGEITLDLTQLQNAAIPQGSTVAYATQLEGPGIAASGTATAAGSRIVLARFGPQMASSRAGALGSVRLTFSPAMPAVGQALSIRCH